MTPDPIDLHAVAGKRYQVEPTSRQTDLWELTIPFRHGHVYPHSGELLGVATNTRSMGLRLAKLAGVEVWQEGDNGFNVVFPPRLFAAVAKIVKPKRKRQLTPKQRLAAVERLAKHRFKHAAQRGKRGQNRPQTVPVDTLAV